MPRRVAAVALAILCACAGGGRAVYHPITCERIGFEVTTLRPSSRPDAMTAEQLRAHLHARPTYFVEAQRSSLTCVDGRDDEHVIGSPGGDAAEFLTALKVYRSTRFGGTRGADVDDVQRVLAQYLAAFTPADRAFYAHTDTEALAALLRAAGAAPDEARAAADADADAAADRAPDLDADGHDTGAGRLPAATAAPAAAAEVNAAQADAADDGAQPGVAPPLDVDIRSPPPHLRDALLAASTDPRHVGCGHMRQFLLRPSEYDTPLPLTHAVIQSVFRYLWASRDAELAAAAAAAAAGEAPRSRTANDLRAVEYDVLRGAHRESAVVVVHSDVQFGACARSKGFVPAVYPTVALSDGSESLMFVDHPAAAAERRRELAAFFAAQPFAGKVPRVPTLHAAIDAEARRHLNLTLAVLAPTLPYFRVAYVDSDSAVTTPGPAEAAPSDGASGAHAWLWWGWRVAAVALLIAALALAVRAVYRHFRPTAVRYSAIGSADDDVRGVRGGHAPTYASFGDIERV